MNDKMLEALRVLAEKLGTTAEYLWGVLVKQAAVRGVMNLVAVALLLVVLAIMARVTAKNWKAWHKEAKYNGLGGALFFAAIVAYGCVLIPLFVFAGAAISCFVNPEYWALTRVIGSL